MSVKVGDAVVLNRYTLHDTGMSWREHIDGGLVGRIGKVIGNTVARPREWVYVNVDEVRTTWPISALTSAACPACMRPLSADVVAVSLYCSSRCRREHVKAQQSSFSSARLCRREGCSNPVEFRRGKGIGKAPIYCSAKCHPAKRWATRNSPRRLHQSLDKQVAAVGVCGHCSAEFKVVQRPGSAKRYCSRRCKEHAKNKRKRLLMTNSLPRVSCVVCRTPAKQTARNRAPHCSGDCRAYAEYIAGARFYAVRIGQRQGGFVRVDTVEVKK